MPRPHNALLALVLLLVLRPLAATELYFLGEPIPDIQRPWSSEDYRQLLDTLRKVQGSQADALPRRGGEFTGPLYQRMVNPENFRPQLNIYVALEQRQEQARDILLHLRELLRLYLDFKAAQQPYASEALGLMSHSLRQQAVLFTLTVEFWMTLSEEERRSPVRLQGLRDTKEAAAQLTRSALDFLDMTRQFGAAELEQYASELSGQLTELIVHLPAPARAEVLARLDSLAREHPLAAVRDRLNALQPTLLAIEDDMRAKSTGAEPILTGALP